tara:strand:- start:6623 stop:6967 length:345 start_codon:yes stop_codon:yes gene_type:complete
MELSLSELASHLGAEVRGDGSTRIGGVATLSSAGANDVTFIADPAYRKQLGTTLAAAVIVSPALINDVIGAALVVDDAYLAFAKRPSCLTIVHVRLSVFILAHLSMKALYWVMG